MPPTENYLNSTWLIVYWTSLLLALKWAGPISNSWSPLLYTLSGRAPMGGWAVDFQNLLHISFPSTLSHFIQLLLFFSLLSMSFFLPWMLHSFHVKPCTFRVLWLVSGTLVKKRNRKHFQNPANKRYSNSQDLSNMSTQKPVRHKLPSLYTTPDFPIWWFRDFST